MSSPQKGGVTLYERRVKSRRGPYKKRIDSRAVTYPVDTQGAPIRVKKRTSGVREHKEPIQTRKWSLDTWSHVTPKTPSDPFAHLLLSKQNNQYAKEQNTNSIELVAYNEGLLVDLLGLCSTSKCKVAVEYPVSRIVTWTRSNSAHTPLDENYIYSIVEPEDYRGWWRTKRIETLHELDTLLNRVALANLDGTDLATLKKDIEGDMTAKELRTHRATLSREGFQEFSLLIKIRYEQAFEQALRARKHELNPTYYHPRDRLAKANQEENVARQLRTFTEDNVNSWTVTDAEDPSIVYTNKDTRVLAIDELIVDINQRVKLEFPMGAPRADQPGYDDAMDAFDLMQKRTNTMNKDERDWETYSRLQISRLGEKALGGGPMEIHTETGIWKLYVKLNQDPLNATVAFFEDPSIRVVKEEDFVAVLKDITVRFEEESQIDSPYSELLKWKRDLVLRQLRGEIGEKLKERWYFVLQHVPPIELKPRLTHCAHPYCVFYKGKVMPPGAFRLIFLNKDMVGEEECWFDEITEGTGTPGRAEDGQMLFCLHCVEDLWNGVGLIKGINREGSVISHSKDLLWRLPTGEIETRWKARMQLSAELASSRHKSKTEYDYIRRTSVADSPGTEIASPGPSIQGDHDPEMQKDFSAPPIQSLEAKYGWPLQPPHRDSWVKAPGLDVFAANLSSFIKPEIRYSANEFYTLNSYEYFALMKWKNMCTRKTMWEIPTNSGFCLQIPGFAKDYDFVDFFGDDILDEHEPKPSIVCGAILDVQPVRADDISTFVPSHQVEDARSSGSDDGQKDGRIAGTRLVKPLYAIMALVDERVKDAWKAMNPSYVPHVPLHVVDIEERPWPPSNFWKSYFRRRVGEQIVAAQQEVIEDNYKKINELLKVLKPSNRHPSMMANRIRERKGLIGSFCASDLKENEAVADLQDSLSPYESFHETVIKRESGGKQASKGMELRPRRGRRSSTTSITTTMIKKTKG